jgi:hypothetical protein
MMTTVIVARRNEEMADAHRRRLNYKQAQTPRFFEYFGASCPHSSIPEMGRVFFGFDGHLFYGHAYPFMQDLSA